MAIASSANAQGRRRDLVEHLQCVADLARTFAAKFGAGELGYWAGLWLDVRKVHPDFQRYLFLRQRQPRKTYFAKLEPKPSKATALTVLTHKLGRALYDLRTREHAFDLQCFGTA
ncbi:MAG: hypothetical protein HY267_02505 [Deltaproteobacteria bacterium]|nr:hypothetical protein [Deltaproteobacteria bacterium]